MTCPSCSAPLEVDPSCVIAVPTVVPYRNEPVLLAHIGRAVLCTRCEYCEEVTR